MKYSKTGKYCIFDSQDYIHFQEAGKLYVFKEFLKSNNARCTDDYSNIYEELELINKDYFNPKLIHLLASFDSDRHYESASSCFWDFCYCEYPNIQDIRKLFSYIWNDVSVVEHSVKEDITCVKPNDDKGGCTMANVNESFKTVLSMKMLKGIMKDGDADLGKLFLMQQMTNGQPLQVSDVIKSKLINEFSLDKDGDLPLEKVLLLQMLDSGSVDLSQLIMFKMMGSLLDEDNDKKKE